MEQATLSLAREGASDRMLAVDLRRADIESALESAGDGRVELLLDIAAREADGETAERHALTVDCTIADLERLLESSSDTVRVGFDAEALARAIREPDTEAHGLREKMAVLAIVVATTGAAAGAAQAMPTQRAGRRHRHDGDGCPGHAGRFHDRVAVPGRPCGPDGVTRHHLRGAGRSAERWNRRPRFRGRHHRSRDCGFAVGCSGT